MARYIKASIVLGRNRIGNQPENLKKYNSWYDYFFDSQCLTDGAFPKGRGCHYCNRIGHQKSNCPEMPQNRGKNRDDYDKSKSNVKNSPKGNRNRKGIESNDFGNDSDLYSSPRYNKKSLLGNVQNQYKRLSINQQNRNFSNPSSPQEAPSSSIRSHRNDRTPGLLNSHQHPQLWHPPSNNNNNHHPHQTPKQNSPSNFNHRSFAHSGNGNRQANTRFGNSRNTQLVNDDSYQYESLEFPELAANKRFTNRRR